MAKKKHRPTSPSVSVKSAQYQRSPARGTVTPPSVSSSSITEQQKELTTTQTTSDSAPVEARQVENVSSKQVKSSSANASAPSAAERRRKRVASQRAKSSARSTPSARDKRRRAERKSWWGSGSFVLIGGIVLIVAVVVGIFVVLGNSQSNTKVSPTDPNVLKKVTSVDQSVLANVKTGGLPNVLQQPPGNPPFLTGPSGKPEIFFYGAEFCPFCGAERWSVTVALSRFGTFTELPLTVSSEDAIPTFTFHGSKYSSNYIDFVPLEAEDQNGQPLETASTAQKQLLSQYGVTGFPFIDIANKYIAKNAAIANPTILTGLSQQQIANMLSDPTQGVTQNIVGAANYFTAAICVVTNNQPASVCNSNPIPDMLNGLPKTALTFFSSAMPLSVAAENCPGDLTTCRRREG